MKISIRDAVPGDYAGISKLHRQLHELHVTNRPDVYQTVENDFDIDCYQTLLNDQTFRVFVAENVAVVAYTIVRVQDAPNIPIFARRRTLHIEDICVDEGLRGRGIGRAVFERVKEYAKSVGAVCLELNVLAFNKDAIEFYRTLNMKPKSVRMELEIE